VEPHSFLAERCSERPGAVKGAFFAAKRTLDGEDRSERIPLEGMLDLPDPWQIGRYPLKSLNTRIFRGETLGLSGHEPVEIGVRIVPTRVLCLCF
jgi:hypothetical protein